MDDVVVGIAEEAVNLARNKWRNVELDRNGVDRFGIDLVDFEEGFPQQEIDVLHADLLADHVLRRLQRGLGHRDHAERAFLIVGPDDAQARALGVGVGGVVRVDLSDQGFAGRDDRLHAEGRAASEQVDLQAFVGPVLLVVGDVLAGELKVLDPAELVGDLAQRSGGVCGAGKRPERSGNRQSGRRQARIRQELTSVHLLFPLVGSQ